MKEIKELKDLEYGGLVIKWRRKYEPETK